MKNLFLLFISLFLVFQNACNRKIPLQTESKKPDLFKITSLKADNISEEITGNDEINLMIWLVKDTIPSPYPIKEWQDSLIFNLKDLQLSQKLSIEHKISLLPLEKTSLVILLMEVDAEKPFKERAKIARKVIQESNYQDYDSLTVQLSRAILDDDLLAISFHKLETLQKTPSGEIVFSGIHLFDKYYYRLKYIFE